MADALTVTRLVRRMKNLLEIEIGEVWVEGEVSNLRRQSSGHSYFTLKDASAQVSCVLFRGNASRAKTLPEDGMQVRMFVDVSVYETRGQLQLIVKQVENAGLGDLQARFEALKLKLDQEGVFSPSVKKKLPKFPRSIAFVTSGTGAALQDMLNILNRRAPWVQAYLYPVTVQGAGAEEGIAHAINALSDPAPNGLPEVDVIIVGRGGGSLEDLWNFNEEVVARAIYACKTPVVSAVGHEIDFTISDFAADMRAPTPSAAVEITVPDAEELRERVSRLSNLVNRIMSNRLKHDTAILRSARRALIPRDAERALRDPIQELDIKRQELKDAADYHLGHLSDRLKELKMQHSANHPTAMMDRRGERLQTVKLQLARASDLAVKQSKERLQNLHSLIRTLGPEATFNRGFSITTDGEGNIVRSLSALKAGDALKTKLAHGEIDSIVCLKAEPEDD